MCCWSLPGWVYLGAGEGSRGLPGFTWVGCGSVSCIGFISAGVWSLQLMSLLPIKCLCLAVGMVL